jgi:hypothetical protein
LQIGSSKQIPKSSPQSYFVDKTKVHTIEMDENNFGVIVYSKPFTVSSLSVNDLLVNLVGKEVDNTEENSKHEESYEKWDKNNLFDRHTVGVVIFRGNEMP